MGVSGWALLAMCAQLAARPTDDAALARIRRALERPAPALNLTLPKTDFYVNVEAIRPFADIFELPPWVTPPSDLAAPHVNCARPCVAQLAGTDPGIIAHSISKAIRTRRAHAEVVEALIEYCAAHRDEPGAAGICGGPPR